MKAQGAAQPKLISKAALEPVICAACPHRMIPKIVSL